MNKVEKKYFFIVLAILCFFIFSCGVRSVSFIDKNVENAVRQTLKVVDRDLTRLDLREIKELELEVLHSADDLHLLKSIRNLSIKNSTDLSGSIVLPPLKKLKSLSIRGTKIEKIDLTDCSKLKEVDLSFNELDEIIFPIDNYIEELFLDSNKLRNIDLTDLHNLVELDLSLNRIITLDLSNQNKLLRLKADFNELESLFLDNCHSLEFLILNDNCLKVLNLKELKNLKVLSCENNFLDELDVSHNLNLRSISCGNNFFSSLDISLNLKIQSFSSSYKSGLYLDVPPGSGITPIFHPRDYFVENRDLLEKVIISEIQNKFVVFSLNDSAKIVNKESGKYVLLDSILRKAPSPRILDFSD
ncbi:MAG: hypothetical protein JXR63_08590 [Spirochaetales bacterium]|nr:hypothetical protein [Spirochaetales bacterium]